MDITVCICTHNRPRYVGDCLEGLRRQTMEAGRFETLIIDSASHDAARVTLARLAAAQPNTRLIRVDQPGVSLARNAGAAAARTEYIAYIDDDAIPNPDWVASIIRVLTECEVRPAIIGGRILPRWEAPLPPWWPASLRGVLSIIEHEGSGEYRTPDLPHGLEPYAANMIVHVPTMRAAGGFGTELGRHAGALLSDEDVQLAWYLQDAGHGVRYDSRILVHHQIQAVRFHPDWLLGRLYWQGASTVLTRRMLGYDRAVWRELPRRMLVALLCAPVGVIPRGSTRWLAPRWRLAYALGFVRAALGWRAAATAMRRGQP